MYIGMKFGISHSLNIPHSCSTAKKRIPVLNCPGIVLEGELVGIPRSASITVETFEGRGMQNHALIFIMKHLYKGLKLYPYKIRLLQEF